MEENTPLYTDLCVAAHFGRWPSEWYALPEEEQDLLRWWYVLHSHKESFALLSKDARAHWPYPPPKR